MTWWRARRGGGRERLQRDGTPAGDVAKTLRRTSSQDRTEICRTARSDGRTLDLTSRGEFAVSKTRLFSPARPILRASHPGGSRIGCQRPDENGRFPLRDGSTEQKIMRRIRANKSNRQVIVVAQDSDIAAKRDAEAVIAMDFRGGQRIIVVEGTRSPQGRGFREEVRRMVLGGLEAFESRHKALAVEVLRAH